MASRTPSMVSYTDIVSKTESRQESKDWKPELPSYTDWFNYNGN